MPPSQKKQIEERDGEIKHLKDLVDDLESKIQAFVQADKTNADYTKQVESQNEALKGENILLKQTISDSTLKNNESTQTIQAQLLQIAELTRNLSVALAKLKDVEDKLNAKVSVVVVGILPWIQRNSPFRLDVTLFTLNRALLASARRISPLKLTSSCTSFSVPISSLMWRCRRTFWIIVPR